MTGSVVLDVVIGLTFVYLIYSLLATLLAEIIATNLGLRARNLHSAIKRMLDDQTVSTFKSFGKSTSGKVIDLFYNHPEVKFLSPNKFFSKPSAIKPESFAKTLVFLLKEKGQGATSIKKIQSGLSKIGLDKETKDYIESLLDDCNNDIDAFKQELERWYDNVMKQATEWYKRNLQILLFFIGLIIATLFNINTFTIVDKLSTDKDARGQMVQIATAYLENNPNSILIPTDDSIDTTDLNEQEIYRAKIDTLLKVKRLLDGEVAKTQTILGGGTLLPDSLTLSVNNKNVIPDYIETDILPAGTIQFSKNKKIKYATFGFWDKLCYVWCMFWTNLLGFATTALAISLGAPFWFDLLNKFMKLRGTLSEKTNGKKSQPVG